MDFVSENTLQSIFYKNPNGDQVIQKVRDFIKFFGTVPHTFRPPKDPVIRH